MEEVGEVKSELFSGVGGGGMMCGLIVEGFSPSDV